MIHELTNFEIFLVAVTIVIASLLIYHMQNKEGSLFKGHTISIATLLVIGILYYGFTVIDWVDFDIPLFPFLSVVIFTYFYAILVRETLGVVSTLNHVSSKENFVFVVMSVAGIIVFAGIITKVLFSILGLWTAEINSAVTFLGSLIATAVVLVPNLGADLTREE